MRTNPLLREARVGDKLILNKGRAKRVIYERTFFKCADWVIDLGPGGGASGGQIIVKGTPEAVAACPESVTGQMLKKVLS